MEDQKFIPHKGCYSCKYRGEIIGSAHSCCRVIRENADVKEQSGLGALAELLLATGAYRLEISTGEDAVKLHPHGVKNGWAQWPVNFDPTWILACVFFTPKETVNEVKV